jgi:hypothetical protein
LGSPQAEKYDQSGNAIAKPSIRVTESVCLRNQSRRDFHGTELVTASIRIKIGPSGTVAIAKIQDVVSGLAGTRCAALPARL